MTVSRWIILALICRACNCASEIPPTGIAGAAINVSETARSELFYRETLGFDPLAPAKSSRMVRYRVGGDQWIELLAGRPDRGERRLARFYLSAPDVRSLRDQLRRGGVEVSEVSSREDGTLTCSLADPDGNVVVIAQIRPGSQTKPAGKKRSGPPLSAHIRHVGIQVASLEASADFYRDKLGLSVERLERGQTRWINMHMAGGDYIQMQVPPHNAPAARRWSLEHFGLDVPDAHAAYSELLRRGVPPTPRFEPVVGYAGHLKLNFADPDGTLIELMELGAPAATERREP